MPSNSGAINNRKYNLGRLACGCASRMGMQPVRLRGMRGMRGMRGLSGNAGVPAGTILAYTANWPDDLLQLNTPDAVQMVIQPGLANQYGIVIDAQSHTQSDYLNFSGQQSMTLQVHTTSDYNAPSDIQSIIDSAIWAQVGAQPASTIRVVQSVAAPTQSLTQQLPLAAGSAAATIANAQQQYAAAAASGNTAAANQYAQQIIALGGSDPRPLNISNWLTANWPWVAAAGIGFVVVKEVI